MDRIWFKSKCLPAADNLLFIIYYLLLNYQGIVHETKQQQQCHRCRSNITYHMLHFAYYKSHITHYTPWSNPSTDLHHNQE